MIELVGNEWSKLRRERALWFALILHLSPWGMVTIAALMDAIGPGPSRYFVFHNQSMLVTALVACVVTSIAFHVELSNRTWFDWLTYPQGAKRLIAAKMITVGAILACFVAITATLMVGLMLASGVRPGTWQMVIAYLSLQCGIFVLVVAISAALCLLTRNVVVVNIIGVAISMVTMVLMGADFSWAVPTVWPYRLGLTLVDTSYAYPWQGALLAGAAVYSFCVAIAYLTAVLCSLRPRTINAPMR